MSEYIVVAGDNLSRIAASHGIRHWQNIYLATENEDFSSTRTNPNLIFPGDRIHIPDRETILPMERHPVLVHRNIPLFTQSAETCWRATAAMLYLRRFPDSSEARFNERIGERYRSQESGLLSENWADFYTRVLGMTETIITGPNDLHRLIATRGPVIAAIGSGENAHSMVVAGYNILRGRWLVLDPAAGAMMAFTGVTITAGSAQPSADTSSSATLDSFSTGPTTWENMSRWIGVYDYTIHARVFHY
ncbi:hypothetical protein MNBD_GAMMA09-1821 [hydrothermal vent metagenome]|uniref:LysM domain-containing protein n=1 Tax=hydrothermal vent metagenome TaxID=652676 RepID=A0A3B0XTY2_9ZZZZ